MDEGRRAGTSAGGWPRLRTISTSEKTPVKDFITPALMQLLAHTPVLLVYVTGIVLAIVSWRRCPTPSLLALIACVLLSFLSVVQPFITNYVIQSRVQMGWSNEKLGYFFSGFGLFTSLVYAIGLGLLLAAVFVPRKPNKQPPALGLQ